MSRPASLHNRVVVKRMRNHTKLIEPVFVQLEDQFVDVETVKGKKYGGPHPDASNNRDVSEFRLFRLFKISL